MRDADGVAEVELEVVRLLSDDPVGVVDVVPVMGRVCVTAAEALPVTEFLALRDSEKVAVVVFDETLLLGVEVGVVAHVLLGDALSVDEELMDAVLAIDSTMGVMVTELEALTPGEVVASLLTLDDVSDGKRETEGEAGVELEAAVLGLGDAGVAENRIVADGVTVTRAVETTTHRRQTKPTPHRKRRQMATHPRSLLRKYLYTTHSSTAPRKLEWTRLSTVRAKATRTLTRTVRATATVTTTQAQESGTATARPWGTAATHGPSPSRRLHKQTPATAIRAVLVSRIHLTDWRSDTSTSRCRWPR